MKYISRDPGGTFDLTKYEDYLGREGLAFTNLLLGPQLLTIDRFVPAGPGSFHDARFASLAVESSAAPNAKADAPTIELSLRGPYFDRVFRLLYQRVERFRFEMPGSEDDLLMHEIRLDDGLVVHELCFDKERSMSISCHTILFSELLES